MKTFAVYRCLYGEDFAKESIQSIEKFCDKIFVFWDDVPWGDVSSVVYLCKNIIFPKKFDNVVGEIESLKNPKVYLIKDHVFNNKNQFTHFVNDLILPKFGKPDLFIFPEIDHVFREDQIELSIELTLEKPSLYTYTQQYEIWKYKWATQNRGRIGTGFWKMKDLKTLPATGRQGNTNGSKIGSFVHNMGFSVSDKVMYWKHLTALAFSRKINDAQPNERWYEDKWLKWDFEKNNRNLAIAFGREHKIPRVNPYPIEELPESVRRKIK